MRMRICVLVVVLASALQVQGSCRKSKICCDGKDAKCVAEDADDDDRCYCDHGCLQLGDCCSDFKDYCGVIDCQVGNWSEWSECDVACGTGTSQRTRKILHPASNEGKQCPPLEEKKTCRESKCSKHHLDNVSAVRESAMLLPGKYGKSFVGDGKDYDVRSNLKTYKRPRNEQPYCVVFQVDKATRSCLNDKDTRTLTKGSTVCAACNSKAQRNHLGGRCVGHGATEGKRTRFKNILTPGCHGKWMRLELVEGQCPCKGDPDFVFV